MTAASPEDPVELRSSEANKFGSKPKMRVPRFLPIFAPSGILESVPANKVLVIQ